MSESELVAAKTHYDKVVSFAGEWLSGVHRVSLCPQLSLGPGVTISLRQTVRHTDSVGLTEAGSLTICLLSMASQ